MLREIHPAAHRLEQVVMKLSLLLSGPSRAGCPPCHLLPSPDSWDTGRDTWLAATSPLRTPPRGAHPRTKRLGVSEEAIPGLQTLPWDCSEWPPFCRIELILAVFSIHCFLLSLVGKLKQMKLKCYFKILPLHPTSKTIPLSLNPDNRNSFLHSKRIPNW